MALATSAPPVTAADLWRPDPQDDCAIGVVTRERYREIAARAAGLPPVPWRAVLAAARSGPNGPLTEHLRRAVEVGTTPDERLAAAHAALRRAGAAYSRASIASDHTPGTAVLPITIAYSYAIDTWSMGLWRPVCRNSALIVYLTLGLSGELDMSHAAVVVPSCFKRFSVGDARVDYCANSPLSLLAQARIIRRKM